MSQEVSQNELKAKTQLLMDGPLKHVKAAALAAALLPLASVAASAQTTQVTCPASASAVCGYVFEDTNHNGIWDDGEPAIEGAKVTIVDEVTNDKVETETGPGGIYYVELLSGSYTVAALIPTGMKTSPTDVGSDDLKDSDGTPDGTGFSVVNHVGANGFPTDFGFFTSPAPNPGTGTPGYWKNHPEAWPVDTIVIGGVTYTKTEALANLAKITKDNTTTMFSSLLSAKLNRLIGNDVSCLKGQNGDTIALADAWMGTYGPIGSNVLGSSAAWKIGEPLHQTLDAYNNGQLCAPHRQ